MERTTCRICHSTDLYEVIHLGHQPPSNALRTFAQLLEPEETFPLTLLSCRLCTLLQLGFDVPHDKLFNEDYPFFSGSVPGTVLRSKDYAWQMEQRLRLDRLDLVVEIGGNDGTLLKCFDTRRLNYEMCAGPAMAAVERGVNTVLGEWGRDTKLPHKAKLIIANNVLAHDPELHSFIAGVASNLQEDGTFTAEFPWALNLIQQGQFDTIYHEHYSYFTVLSLSCLFAAHGMAIYDLEELPDLHGGSLRIYAGFAARHGRSAAVGHALLKEGPLCSLDALRAFHRKAWDIREAFEDFIEEYGPVWAYGAAAKGNTFINWLKLDMADILAVGDDTPAKIGKNLPGSCIPIISGKDLLDKRPEYVVILPWNWAPQIAEKLNYIRGWGGQFVTAIPDLKVF